MSSISKNSSRNNKIIAFYRDVPFIVNILGKTLLHFAMECYEFSCLDQIFAAKIRAQKIFFTLIKKSVNKKYFLFTLFYFLFTLFFRPEDPA